MQQQTDGHTYAPPYAQQSGSYPSARDLIYFLYISIIFVGTAASAGCRAGRVTCGGFVESDSRQPASLTVRTTRTALLHADAVRSYYFLDLLVLLDVVCLAVAAGSRLLV